MRGSAGQTFSKALVEWEKEKKINPAEAEEIKIIGKIPLIDRLDPQINTLVKCKKLSLSTNCINKIISLNGLRCLQILSLGRNQIPRISGLEDVGDTLEQLWISYNNIDKLDGLVPHCVKLKILYITNNKISSWNEVDKLKDLPALTQIALTGNEIYDKFTKGEGRIHTLKRLPALQVIDSISVRRFFENFVVLNGGLMRTGGC
jgi:dynein light chain 1, axonemal